MSLENNLHIQRKFGYLRILWRIQNFWLATCKKNWEIISPEFTVRSPRPTSWRFILKPMSKDVVGIYLCLYLERLHSDSYPEIVKANWKLNLLNCKRKQNSLFRELEYLFKINRRYGEIIESMDCLLKDFKPFEVDDLHIQCRLFVSSDTDSAAFLSCYDKDLRSLSDDLHTLFRNGYGNDMTLRVENEEIKANKAILCARNSTLASIIEGNKKTNVIDLLSPILSDSNLYDSTETCLLSSSFVNVDAVKRIVDYIYCGNLNVVISKPSVCLSECVHIFDIGEVATYYIPDELTLNSAVDVVENVFSWFITNFETRNVDCILSPPLTQGLAKPEWRLKLFPRGKNVELYAEMCENGRAQEVCLEFGILDANQNIYCYRKLSKLVSPGEILGIDDFIQETHLENHNFLSDGTLRIIFKLRTSTGVSSMDKVCSSITSVTDPPVEFSLKLVSKDIARLFHNGDLSDFVIRCDDQVFRVHSFIMAARSDAFPRILSKHAVSENEIYLPNMKGSTLSIFLIYLYSGILEQGLDPGTINELIRTASYFEVYALINSCSRILAESNCLGLHYQSEKSQI